MDRADRSYDPGQSQGEGPWRRPAPRKSMDLSGRHQGQHQAPRRLLSSRVVSWRYLPRRWLLWLVQPDVEEVVQVPAAVTLGQGDELGRGHIPVPVLGCPVTEDAEEHAVADLLAQGLQGHAA